MTEIALRPAPAEGYRLADRFRHGSGPVLLTGVQAVARLLVELRAHDRRHGRRTATFVSGYQGSPLGGVDTLLAGMPEVLADNDIVFRPGLNEELAATAVWGSQIGVGTGSATHEGVIGVWYGKGPGLDRATDALRHATLYGVDPRGGMLLLVGDDPGSKSSSLPVVSERSLAALHIPVLVPRDAADIVRLGIHGLALSRASGCPVALKIVSDVADGGWRVDGSIAEVEPVAPEIAHGAGTFTYRQRPMTAGPATLEAEADLLGPRRRVVRAYAAANAVDVLEVDPPRARIGVMATGATFSVVRQALRDMDIDDDALTRAGIRLLRIGLVHPLSPDRVREFVRGVDMVLVVEEKAAFLESQLRDLLYGTADAPLILGKSDETGRALVPADGELTVLRVRRTLARFLHGYLDFRRPLPAPLSLEPLSTRRAAFFCSGCPHNRSTRVPEGSVACGGIGCHTMVAMADRADMAVVGLTQMGGEGAQWIGQSPFTDVGHIFQNLGDGTYFHSGQLAVQACRAAGVNITFKILFNEVVAMTGAQEAEGGLTVAALTRKLADEGVARTIVCAEDPRRHRRADLAPGTLVWSRDRLDEAQRALREIPGVTVLIYDQHCAANARRQRKRGRLPDKRTRVVINEAVCEGCGDCGVKSNCLSVQPVDTEFGRKTRIDQTSCNLDYSCLDGDCPSFVTVEVGDRRSPRPTPTPPEVPEPPVLADADATRNVLMAGVGGTGIVTVDQVLATAAVLAGLHVSTLDQTGLSQKAGPVVSHLRYGPDPEPAHRLGPGSADCLLAFDLLTAADAATLTYGSATRTVAIASTGRTPTGEMIHDITVEHPDAPNLLSRLAGGCARVESFDALAASSTLFGETTQANFLLVGAAHQLGALGIPAWAVERAITLNGVAVDRNIAAFRWGRALAANPAALNEIRPSPPAAPTIALDAVARADFPDAVRAVVARRAAELIAYQNRALAEEYVEIVRGAWEAERAITDNGDYTLAVARGLFRFMAYKDEYEVARLLTDPVFADHLSAQVPDARRPVFRLHPPLLRSMGMRNKIGLGPRAAWALRILAASKRLRGTILDPFGYGRVRVVERILRDHFIRMVSMLNRDLTEKTYRTALAAVGAAEMVRGYEQVKLDSVRRYRATLRELGLEPPELPGAVPVAHA
ncbi:indolepyruvate ferredoxin oxidoreductase family protein [Nocardia takedensis]